MQNSNDVTQCLALTRQRSRCRLLGSSDQGGYCHIHRYMHTLHPNTRSSKDVDDRLVNLITVGTGLITLFEKAIQYVPDLCIYVATGSPVPAKKFVESLRASLDEHLSEEEVPQRVERLLRPFLCAPRWENIAPSDTLPSEQLTALYEGIVQLELLSLAADQYSQYLSTPDHHDQTK